MSWYDYYHSTYETKIDQLAKARRKFCGLDTRQVKLLLNKLAKTDEIAEAYRYALEAEDCNIKAKQYRGTYRDSYYSKKDDNIRYLADLCKEKGWCYGIQESDLINIPWVVYFDLPDCQQISFHTKSNIGHYPRYEKEWDGMDDSTLPKIEAAITMHFAKELEERKAYLDSTKDKRAAAAKKRAENKVEAERKKEEARRKKEEETELRKQRWRENTYSTAKMKERYDEFVAALNENAGQYVRIKFCKDGMFAADNAGKRRFNLFVWGDEKLCFYRIPRSHISHGKWTTPYYDGFVCACDIINVETSEHLVSPESIDRINAEKHAAEEASKAAAKTLAKKRIERENEALKPWLEKNPEMTKTLYKNIAMQIRKLKGSTHIAVIETEFGMFRRKGKKKNPDVIFNPLLENKMVCVWKPEYAGMYTRLPVNKIYSNVDNSEIRGWY